MTPGIGSSPGDPILAVDAGQSAIKVRYDGEHVREWAGPGIRTDLPLRPQLADVIRDAFDRGCRPTTVGIGVSGLTHLEADAVPLLRSGPQQLGVRTITLAHDSVTAYLGALGEERGVVIAAGTGSVAFAVGATEVARIDGWGNLMGDAGSGYWIGREALDAAMRAHDGRGPQTALLDLVGAEFPDVEAAYIELQADPKRVERIAAHARQVCEIADHDAVARDIATRAAGELALSAFTGLRRVDEHTARAPRIRAAGGIFRSHRIVEEFESGLRSRLPGADIQVADAHPLDGAEMLARVADGSVLATLISRARA
ncbi:N-acetylglucosamine kinase-like BadF-type ATPase [Agromyces terreus]|uniref:N-acetylglucosamine kinase-like BadF-type ATPase n=2 Tax=Agromyces terreus TaxID=424795 RepID=A0A9X2KCB4_9MICO|nr:BadF/BadG/BcrA/BcrD ATPase family protein [Agromyces terreus]MCP2371201.1 N-acetylglucosamine kinase-like BadF-type ATPase [Agromyces terreus]